VQPVKDALWRAARSGASDFKTSVVFSVPEGPGQLFKALSVFALRELDMSKVESRPMRSNPIQLAESAGKNLKTLLTSQQAALVQLRNPQQSCHTDGVCLLLPSRSIQSPVPLL